MVKPIWDYVLIELDEVKTKTDSGLYIAESAKERDPIATVLAIGKDVTHVKIGDKVIFSLYASRTLAGDVTNSDGGQRLVKEREIQAIL